MTTVRATLSQRGFTAVEVLVVVAILGILAAFAAPSMVQLIRTQKVRTAAYDIFADLTYAWSAGWGIRDQTTGEILRTQGALSSGLSFTGDAGSLTFDRSGRTSGNVSLTIQPAPVDPAIPDNQKRCVRLSASGRPTSQEGLCPAGVFQ